ncbi:uncharacterized protein TNCT_29681 [Trichonephila clavata]|uniref:Uncharacterized protein n=1 Tax=Trichonephila clavata TaxID=2740835 RepID=A0A8X6LB48_TRICU|nr:uncharacterized protein TNCT_29681 [Trichonephila clavata]
MNNIWSPIAEDLIDRTMTSVEGSVLKRLLFFDGRQKADIISYTFSCLNDVSNLMEQLQLILLKCYEEKYSSLLGPFSRKIQTINQILSKEYARRYPSHRPPDVNVIRRLDYRLRNTGSVWPTSNLHDTGRPRSGLTVAQADAILYRVEETPEVSTCVLAREITSSKSTVHRLLRSERLYPFRYTIVQGLKPDDCQKRVAFCKWPLQQQNTDN